LGLFLAWGVTECFSAPAFYSTSDPVDHWYVSTNVGGADGQLSSFTTNNFIQAVAVSGKPDYIANNNTGTNGAMETWTFFVFRQIFYLTGYNPATADLSFKWAADDSGEGIASRGTWVPKFSLNGGSFQNWPGPGTATYDYGNTVTLTSGFFSGLNTIDFYVEGNGVTDGFELKALAFL
jgi:hypothetical protein